MKYLIGLILLACLHSALCDFDDFFDDDDDNRPCRSNADCEYDDCCAQSSFGNGRVCKDKGDTGDRCGGLYLCECERGYTCTPDQGGFQNQDERFGKGSCRRTGIWG